VVGEKLAETEDTISVKNPVIIHIQTQAQTAQINVQFFPVIMKEMLADGDDSTEWLVLKKNITLCVNPVLNARLLAQYNHIFAPLHTIPSVMGQQPMPQGTPANQGTSQPIIKLFDN
jgi:hypothetical protein